MSPPYFSSEFSIACKKKAVNARKPASSEFNIFEIKKERQNRSGRKPLHHAALFCSVSRNDGMAVRIDRNADTILFAVPVFPLTENVASGMRKQLPAKCHRVFTGQLQIFSDAFPAKRCGMQQIQIGKQFVHHLIPACPGLLPARGNGGYRRADNPASHR